MHVHVDIVNKFLIIKQFLCQFGVILKSALLFVVAHQKKKMKVILALDLTRQYQSTLCLDPKISSANRQFSPSNIPYSFCPRYHTWSKS
jgi:hypothetical protein